MAEAVEEGAVGRAVELDSIVVECSLEMPEVKNAPDEEPPATVGRAHLVGMLCRGIRRVGRRVGRDDDHADWVTGRPGGREASGLCAQGDRAHWDGRQTRRKASAAEHIQATCEADLGTAEETSEPARLTEANMRRAVVASGGRAPRLGASAGLEAEETRKSLGLILYKWMSSQNSSAKRLRSREGLAPFASAPRAALLSM